MKDGYIWFLFTDQEQDDLLRIIGTVKFNVQSDESSPVNTVPPVAVRPEVASK